MESSLFVAHLDTDEKSEDDPDSHITAVGMSLFRDFWGLVV